MKSTITLVKCVCDDAMGVATLEYKALLEALLKQISGGLAHPMNSDCLQQNTLPLNSSWISKA